MNTIVIKTPIGLLKITEEKGQITEIRETSAPHEEAGSAKGVLGLASTQINEYFKGNLKEFTFPIQLKGTPFQKLVWEACYRIPYGSSVTYSTIAEMIGKPNAVRAVGTALGRNPILLVIPCHRIVPKQNSPAEPFPKLIGGFRLGAKVKRMLLKHESVNRICLSFGVATH